MFVTWEEQYLLARALAAKVRSSGYRPDLVIAIGRGGYIPARILCDLLSISRLTSVKAEHWGTPAEKEDRAVIRYPLCIPIEGEKVLIVDDVTDTGESMALVLEYVKALGPAEVRTAVLQHKEVSGFLPDYYAQVCPVWQWIVYPWALHEDLLGFSRKILAAGPVTPARLKEELSSRFGFIASEEEVRFALEDLLSSGEIVREGAGYRKKTC
ncbi:MAG TPA: phosphoribosyltransferase [Methanomicrobiales archaeon]|nr:phosphoribosyltransferase [Methanomicrobiales archaeon]